MVTLTRSGFLNCSSHVQFSSRMGLDTDILRNKNVPNLPHMLILLIADAHITSNKYDSIL